MESSLAAIREPLINPERSGQSNRLRHAQKKSNREKFVHFISHFFRTGYAPAAQLESVVVHRPIGNLKLQNSTPREGRLLMPRALESVISVDMKNPFPGMNPWLEAFWRDIHAKLLVYACDQLNAELPSGMVARVDERLAIDAEQEKERTYLPDIAVTEPWDRPAGPVLGQGGQGVIAAEPTIVDFGQEILRRVEIVDSRAHVITAIELLSPTNKEEPSARVAWKTKRMDYLRGGISLVEIDLLRTGGWTLPDRSRLKPISESRVFYHTCVTRPPWWSRHEFYVLPLREKLPIIRIPLRRPDPDAGLDLQALVDQCYERGRYASALDYTKPPVPALPEEEATWAGTITGVTS